MDAAQWWIFLPACIGMNFFPGPNNLLALVHGTRTNGLQATLAGLGRLPPMVILLLLLSVGLESLLATSHTTFQWLRWIGAGYLLWMAWQAFNTPVVIEDDETPLKVSIIRMSQSEALVACTNPKLILIFYAFFPQFIDVTEIVSKQIMVMGITFLVIEIASIILYAFGGRWLQRRLKKQKNSRWLSRISALALSAAAGLVLIP